MVEHWQSPTNRFFLKVISIVVIVTFMTTQFDLRLAFGFVYAPTPQAPVGVDQESLKNELESARYFTDEDEQSKAAQQGAPEKQPEAPTGNVAGGEINDVGFRQAENLERSLFDSSKFFLTSPLSSPVGDVNGVFSGLRSEQGSEQYGSDGRIRAIRMFDDQQRSIERSFLYDDDEGTVTVLTKFFGEKEKPAFFQKYALDPSKNKPAYPLETGYRSEGKDYLTRSYQWSADGQEEGKLIVYDPKSEGALYAAYGLQPDGSLGRLREYRGSMEVNGETKLVHLSMEYDSGVTTVREWRSGTWEQYGPEGLMRAFDGTNVRDFVYDENGQLARVEVSDSNGESLFVEEYDAAGNVRLVRNQDGTVYSFKDSLIQSIGTADGRLWNYQYDAYGRMVP